MLHYSSSQRCNDGRERCCGAGRQHAAVCNILAMLLQQRTGPYNVTAMASNATLLRQCVGPCNVVTTTRWTLQHCYDNALNLATLLRQRVGPCNVTVMAGNALDLVAVL
ncbi:unnamed protein product [Sphagnum balticum]